MADTIGIRHETKSRWERRVPLIPAATRRLRQAHGIEVILERSPKRVFSEEEFARAGATVRGDLSPARVVLGVKEIPAELLEPGKTYVFFAHVIKGQQYNMPMLRRILDLGCTLVDYERIADESGRRLIFFGRHAGLAGAVDSLWALGQRLSWEGIPTGFSLIRPAHTYSTVEEARGAVREAGRRIADEGLPETVSPCIIGVAGYGNVAGGVQEILSALPAREIDPAEVETVATDPRSPRNEVFRVTFREEHLVEPTSPEAAFELQDYYHRPERYRSVFARYLPHLTVLMNCIYWTERYPRLVTREDVRTLYAADGRARLTMIGDISADLEGAVECTTRQTGPDDPVYVYQPATGETISGVAGDGPVILAVDALPAEFPREASETFSVALEPLIPGLARADYSVPFPQLDLPPEIKRAVIAHRGRLAPAYTYIEEFLDPTRG